MGYLSTVLVALCIVIGALVVICGIYAAINAWRIHKFYKGLRVPRQPDPLYRSRTRL